MSILTFSECPVKVNFVYQVTDVMKRGTDTNELRITWIEERETYWYFGYVPVGRSAGYCGFGASRISKDGYATNFGISELIELREFECRPTPPLPCLKGNPSYDLMM